MLAVAEMYVKGVSTREVEAVMREFGIESLSSSQVSRAAKLLDDELQAWRTRPLGRDPIPDPRRTLREDAPRRDRSRRRRALGDRHRPGRAPPRATRDLGHRSSRGGAPGEFHREAQH